MTICAPEYMECPPKKKHKIDRKNEKSSYSKINITWPYVVTYALEWMKGAPKRKNKIDRRNEK